MSLLHRLSLAQKFLIQGFVAFVMVAIPTGLYMRYALDDVTQAQRQVEGGKVLAEINHVIQFTQTHRGLSASIRSSRMPVRRSRFPPCGRSAARSGWPWSRAWPASRSRPLKARAAIRS